MIDQITYVSLPQSLTLFLNLFEMQSDTPKAATGRYLSKAEISLASGLLG